MKAKVYYKVDVYIKEYYSNVIAGLAKARRHNRITTTAPGQASGA